MTLPRSAPIPGRLPSVGGNLERTAATLLDVARRHLDDAHRNADRPAAWSHANAAGLAVLDALAELLDVDPLTVAAMYVDRYGAPPWRYAGKPAVLDAIEAVEAWLADELAVEHPTAEPELDRTPLSTRFGPPLPGQLDLFDEVGAR